MMDGYAGCSCGMNTPSVPLKGFTVWCIPRGISLGSMSVSMHEPGVTAHGPLLWICFCVKQIIAHTTHANGSQCWVYITLIIASRPNHYPSIKYSR